MSRNNDESNTAKATISNNELRIVTDKQIFVFEYSGVSGLEITNEMVIPLYSVNSTEYTQGTGSTGVSKTSIPIYMDYIDTPYTITLKTDGTAELSHGESIIEGDWYYENLLFGGPDVIDVDIFVSANLFTYEDNEEEFEESLVADTTTSTLHNRPNLNQNTNTPTQNANEDFPSKKRDLIKVEQRKYREKPYKTLLLNQI